MTFQELGTQLSEIASIQQSGDFRSAARLARNLLRTYEMDRGLDSNWALILETAADLEMTQGRFSIAAGYYGSLVQWCSDDEDAHRNCALKWLDAELAQGRCGRTEALQAVEAFLGPFEDLPVDSTSAIHSFWSRIGWPTETRAHARLVLAKLAAVLGQYSAASNLLANVKAEGPSLAEAIRETAASVALEAGDLALAERLLESNSKAHMLRAKFYFTRGDLGVALKETSKDVEEGQRSRSLLYIARALLNRAAIRVPLNQTFEAREDAAVALRLAPSDPLCREMTKLVDEAARIREGSGSKDFIGWTALTLQVGRSSSKSAPLVLHAIAERPTSFLAYYELEEASFLRRCAGEAKDFRDGLDELRRFFGNSDSKWIERRLRALHGRRLWLDGNTAGALRCWAEVSAEWREAGARMEAYQIDRWRREVSGPDTQLDELLNRDLDRLATSLSDSNRASFLLDKWNIEERRWEQEAQNLMQDWRKNHRFWPLLLWRKTVRFVSSTCASGTHRATEIHRDGDTAPWDPIGLARAWWNCGWDEAALSTITLADRTYFCLWRWGAVDFWEASLSRLELRASVQQFHFCLTAFTEGSNADALEILKEIGSRSGIAPRLANLPPRIRRLCLFLDDQWLKMPFACLTIGSQTLIDRFGLRTEFSWQARASVRTQSCSALIVSVDEGDAEGILGEARAEAEWIAKWCESHRYQPVTWLHNQHVSRKVLSAELPKAALFHFSGHGGFESDRGAGSGLVLYKGVEQFTFADVAALQNLPIRLAVLMACHGADGMVFPGRIVTSLPQLLRLAQSSSIIAPLWEIRDDVAHRFTQLFYGHLAGMTIRDAFRHSLLSLREEYPEIFNWASLQLYGEGS